MEQCSPRYAQLGRLLGPKNWRYRCDSFGASSYDSTGKPLTSASTSMTSCFLSVGPSTTIDQTLVTITGLWAVGWDDTGDYVHNPTTCGLVTYSPLLLSITERLDLYNPGNNGVGIVRVFQITQLSTSASGQWVATPDWICGSRSPTRPRSSILTSLVVYAPGDFTYAARPANHAGSVRSLRHQQRVS